jgi:hypothetical protein
MTEGPVSPIIIAVVVNEEKLLERLDQAIWGVIDNPDKT